MTAQSHFRLPLASVVTLLAAASASMAQYSSDTATNLLIADGANGQEQAKIRRTSDDGCYISWYDNSTGGFDTRVQRLDARGNALWPHNGVLVADTSFSSSQDYGFAVDGSNNALIAFRDDRSGSTHITVNKISPTGVLLWGNAGVQVSVNANGNNPKVAATSDGHCVVGWSENNRFHLQRLDANGSPQWTAGGIINVPATGQYGISEIVSSDNGNVIVLWIRYVSTFLSDKHLYTQKFNTAGDAVWNAGSPVIIFDANSIANGYFPSFLSDGNGGAVYGWYEVGSTRNCFVQRVDAAGVKQFQHNGVPVATTAVIRLSPGLAYHPVTRDIYLFWSETNVAQSIYSLHGQRVDEDGARMWTDTGKQIIPSSSNQISFINAVANDQGAMVFCFDRSGSSYLVGAHLDVTGNLTWPGNGVQQVCSTLSGKSRMNAVANSCGDALLVWTDARNDSGNVYAQNVKPNGEFGVPKLADINGDSAVGVPDLLAVISQWGACVKQACPADIAPLNGCSQGDGSVGVPDLLMVIANWG